MPNSDAPRLKTLGDLFSDDACPLCGVLKEFQASYLRQPDTGLLVNVCSFHTWMIAKMAEAEGAAALYLRLLDRDGPDDSEGDRCDVCAHIRREETTRLKEFVGRLARPEVLEWLQQRGTLCIPHAQSLLAYLPESLQNEVLLALKKRRAELRKKLVELLRDARGKRPVHGGVLGRVAEYLVAQRGLGLHS
jgi:hypothetical protein